MDQTTVTIRSWAPRDSADMSSWPADSDRFAWLWSMAPRQPGVGGRRRWAIVAGGELVGRLTLREIDTLQVTARLGIFIRPDRRGQGMGAAAMCQLAESWFAKGGWALRLDCWAGNRRALELYHRLGWSELSGSWVSIPNHPDLAGELGELRTSIRPVPPAAWSIEMGLTRESWYEQSGRRVPGGVSARRSH